MQKDRLSAALFRKFLLYNYSLILIFLLYAQSLARLLSSGSCVCMCVCLCMCVCVSVSLCVRMGILFIRKFTLIFVAPLAAPSQKS